MIAGDFINELLRLRAEIERLRALLERAEAHVEADEAYQLRLDIHAALRGEETADGK